MTKQIKHHRFMRNKKFKDVGNYYKAGTLPKIDIPKIPYAFRKKDENLYPIEKQQKGYETFLEYKKRKEEREKREGKQITLFETLRDASVNKGDKYWWWKLFQKVVKNKNIDITKNRISGDYGYYYNRTKGYAGGIVRLKKTSNLEKSIIIYDSKLEKEEKHYLDKGERK